jgi:pumilio RNA-binding family
MLRTISIIVRDSSKSRELQQALGRASRTQLDDVIQRISDEIVDLAEDRHANFVIQKLFEVGSPVQRQRLLELISGNVSRLSRNSFGTRVLQTIVMSGEVQHQSWIIEEIEHDFLGACSDEHANWLVLKLFQLCPDYLIVRFMDLVVPIAMEMIDNRFGCRVVLVILERFLPMGYPRGNPNAPEQKALVKTSAV